MLPYLVLHLISAILANEMVNFWLLDHHSIRKRKKLLLAYPVSRLSVDLIHEFYQPRQCCQSLIQGLPVRIHLQRVHSSVPVGAEPLTHHFLRADEVGFEDQFIRNTRRSRFTLLLEPQVLHLKRYIGISGASIHIVIKIMLPRSHGPKCKRETRLTGSDQTLNVIREGNHSGSDLQIKISESATCSCSPGRDGIEKQGGMFRDEGSAEPALAEHTILLTLDIPLTCLPSLSAPIIINIYAIFHLTV